MEFVRGTCPKCNGTLQIPSDRASILCMYCGAKIETAQAIADTSLSKETGDVVQHASNEQWFHENLSVVKEAFPQMLFGLKDPLKNFKKNLYETKFKEYIKEHESVLKDIEDMYSATLEPEKFVEELVSYFVKTVEAQVLSRENKRKQEECLMDYNMSMVIYVNPALKEQNRLSGAPLVDMLLQQWKITFPKTNLKPSSFAEINGGFKRRFCYITTAVCENLGKQDNCYELTMLRSYRDGYLQNQENGLELVKTYYDIAPTIVKRINKIPECGTIYRNIWNDYLCPCIRYIEENENEQCLELYTKMIDDLSDTYFNSERIYQP
ncbi:hypothetical protein LQZ18_08710 [Lachnospiraceae bacterium ZAX-1]